MSKAKLGDVIERGTVPCRVCKQPHDSRVVQVATKHQGLMYSWAAEDGHSYVKMSAEEVVVHLAPPPGPHVSEESPDE